MRDRKIASITVLCSGDPGHFLYVNYITSCTEVEGVGWLSLRVQNITFDLLLLRGARILCGEMYKERAQVRYVYNRLMRRHGNLCRMYSFIMEHIYIQRRNKRIIVPPVVVETAVYIVSKVCRMVNSDKALIRVFP